jgi:hypothetical protein
MHGISLVVLYFGFIRHWLTPTEDKFIINGLHGIIFMVADVVDLDYYCERMRKSEEEDKPWNKIYI